MNKIQMQRFNRLREMVADEIARQLAITAKPDFYQITLHCNKCELDIDKWCVVEVDNEPC